MATPVASGTAPQAAPAPLLRLRGVSKGFFGTRVLHDVSFDAQAGQVLGLVGENGSGKSTAMNLLGGVHRRDSGAILFAGAPYEPRDPGDAEAAGIAFIQQELNVFPNLSVEENLFLGRYPRLFGRLPVVDRPRLRQRARELLAQVELRVAPQTQASELSPGERQLLEIAKALSQNARLVIFDEPTTSLTSRESARLFELIGRLRAQGIGIIYISHVLSDVLRLADRIVVLRDGHLVLDADRADVTTDRLVTAMVGRSIETLFPRRAEAPPGRTLLEAEHVTQPGVVRGISLTVRAREIVGIAGLMGSGRSELARILFGLDPLASGRILMEGRPLPQGDLAARITAGIAFLTEDRRHEGLMLDGTVRDNLALAALPLHAGRIGQIDDGALGAQMARMHEQLRIKAGAPATTPARALSGGNQQKVVLGKWLLRRPRLLILDEPTRGIDIGAKQEIYRLICRLAEDGMGVLVISSEMEELIGLCDRILVMCRGEITGAFARGEFDREAILRAAMKVSGP